MTAHCGSHAPVAHTVCLLVTAAGILVAARSADVLAQTSDIPPNLSPQAAVSVGGTSVSDSFFEMQGISWSLAGPNWFARFGPRPPGVSPAFGNFPGDAGGSVGFGIRGERVQGEFFGRWSQGYRSAATFQSPSLMLSDGAYGWWWDASATPFVMGVVPVLGDRPGAASRLPPLSEPRPTVLERSEALSATGIPQIRPNDPATGRNTDQTADAVAGGNDRIAEAGAVMQTQESAADAHAASPAGRSHSGRPMSAETQDVMSSSNISRAWSTAVSEGLGVDEAERLRAAEVAAQNREAETLLRKAAAALEAGRAGSADVYCRMALARATGAVRAQALQLQARISAARRPPGP